LKQCLAVRAGCRLYRCNFESGAKGRRLRLTHNYGGENHSGEKPFSADGQAREPLRASSSRDGRYSDNCQAFLVKSGSTKRNSVLHDWLPRFIFFGSTPLLLRARIASV
jgi:hypothetical protein